MTSVVTGARGFVGAALIRELRARGETVVAVTRLPPPPGEDAALIWKQVDPATPRGWAPLFDQPVHALYHLAWSTIPRTADSDPAADLRDNLGSSLALLEAMRTSGQRPRVVFASSGGTVYGPSAVTPIPETHPTAPICAYGVTKLAVENYLEMFRRLHGFDAVSLRIGNAFGPGQDTDRGFGAVTTFAVKALRREVIPIHGDGEVVRDYLHIDDLAAALMAARDARLTGAVNIGSGEGVSLNQIVALLESELGRPILVDHGPRRPFDVPVSVLDIGLARAALGWRPRLSFGEGLRRLLGSLKGAAI